MRELLNRIIDWLRRDKLEKELTEELRFHRAQLERDALGAGAPADEAPYVAKRQLGNVTRVTEQARDRWSLPPVEQVLQDLRYALRGLRRSPGFTATVVVTLALGIGANAAMFGVVDRLMFRPFAYLRDPATAHRIYLQATYRGDRNWGYGGEYTRYLDFRKFTSKFAQFAAFTNRSIAVGVGDAAMERTVGVVSASFFDFFDAPPVLGRYFTPAEDSVPLGDAVAVLGYGYWKSEYGGRDVRGERIQVGPLLTTIIGVAPEGFAGVSDLSPPAG